MGPPHQSVAPACDAPADAFRRRFLEGLPVDFGLEQQGVLEQGNWTVLIQGKSSRKVTFNRGEPGLVGGMSEECFREGPSQGPPV